MLKIGLTGGIGSGKTVVARIFETLGIPVYYADEAAKRLMNTNETLKRSIIQNFGPAAFKKGELDRKYLAGIVFNDSKKLELLNSLTHPATIRDAHEWMHRQDSPYLIKEAALLFESGADLELDHVIGVFAPREMRIKRVIERDGLPEDEVMKRLNRQMDEDQKLKLCDFVIHNDEEQLLIPQVLDLHKKFLQTAATIH